MKAPKSSKSKKRTSKKAHRNKKSPTGRTASERKAKVKSIKKKELMMRLEVYLKESSKHMIPERLKEVQKWTKKSKQSIQSAYLYGEGDYDFWSTIEHKLAPISEEALIQLWNSWPHLQEKLNKLPAELKRYHRNGAKMSKRELKVVNDLIEAGLRANLAVKDDEN